MSAAPLASVPLAVNGAPCLLHRVRFRSAADGGGLPLLATLRDPQPALAVLAQRIELSEDAELPETAVDDELLVIFANAGLQTGHAWRQRLEAWMAAGEDERQPTLEAPSFGERVLWRPGRALVIGNPERCRELLEGLAVFAWHEGHLRRLEGETAAAWEPAQADVELTQLPRRAALRRQEYALLRLLLENSGKVLSRNQLEQSLYGWSGDVESNAIEVHVHHLRRKLGNQLIRTVRGIGYGIDQPAP